MIRALGYSLIAAATLTACSGNDVKDTFAGIPVTSNPEGATVYVGTAENWCDAHEHSGQRLGTSGWTSWEYRDFEGGGAWVSVNYRTRRPGSHRRGTREINLACRSEAFQPSDLPFSPNAASADLGGIDKRVDRRIVDSRMDEMSRRCIRGPVNRCRHSLPSSVNALLNTKSGQCPLF